MIKIFGEEEEQTRKHFYKPELLNTEIQYTSKCIAISAIRTVYGSLSVSRSTRCFSECNEIIEAYQLEAVQMKGK
jgi:hypothetical protein